MKRSAHRWNGTIHCIVALGAVGAAAPAFAQSPDNSPVKITTNATVTYGIAQRTDDVEPTLVPYINANSIGVKSGNSLGGKNASSQSTDDGNLNYGKNAIVSRVLKAYGSVNVDLGQWGGFLALKAWNDFALENDSVRWGNDPNNYVHGTPLSDSTFTHRAKFSGVAVQSAYLFGKTSLRDTPVSWKVGGQNFDWGRASLIGGGLKAINPVDAPAAFRPGALPEEVLVPIPAAQATANLTKELAFEGFVQLANAHSVVHPCGTFLSLNDYMQPGCDRLMSGGAAGTDTQRAATGNYVARVSDPHEDVAGQFGLSLRYDLTALNTRAGIYYFQNNSRTPVIDLIKSTRPGAGTGTNPVIGSDPKNNTKYRMEYPEDVRTFGFSTLTRFDSTGITLGTEGTYRPNQPIMLNAPDALGPFNATVASPSAHLLYKDWLNTAPGQAWHAWDSREVSQLSINVAKNDLRIAGAAGGSIAIEVAGKWVNDLPDVSVRRYGRMTQAGRGFVKGVCTVTSTSNLPELQCTTNGYVSKEAIGATIAGSLMYANVGIDGLNLRGRFSYTKGLRGWSYDGLFSEGATTTVLGLDVEYLKRYFAAISLTNHDGGDYNTLKDRSYLSMNIGMKF
ncbi:DUF1302 domain-containing protein [Aromatoleum toluolicum]|uniref:DUF1302 family protein n=1 Tax=Aromatoleum toluolicum TaxID=90060 RepID=A0ABX1NI63_9RHOO|nr:DUF1302 family protein [Aromatoleum toluolicum]NMF98843.1 DUF1302 domain-containing protein [Aromatoleum toluolicum]